MRKRTLGTTSLAVAAVLFLALHLLAGLTLRSARLDLTENGLYTLTEGSRNIVRKLDEPIRLRFFFSESLAGESPFLRTYANRVRDLLEEYVAASRGKLLLEVSDPEPFSEAEDEAVAAGLQGVSLGAARDVLYLGLLGTNSVDERAVIPFLDPSTEDFLEYDLSRFLTKLAHPRRPVVGVLSSLPIHGQERIPVPGAPPPSPPWFVLEQIRELYELRELDFDLDAVPGDVDVLMLVHPKALSDATLFAVDQFVLGGGRALVFVDPHCEEDTPPADPSNPFAGMGQPRSSDLSPLLAAWGVQYDPEVVLGDRGTARRVTPPGARPEPVDYVVWLQLRPDNLDAKDPVTGGLGLVNVAAAGVLAPVEGASTEFTPLAWSSPASMEIESAQLRFMPDPARLLTGFRESGEVLTLAARLHGPADTAFPEGRPGAATDDEADDAASEGTDDAEDESEAAPSEFLTSSTGPIHVVVVADADLLADRWWVAFRDFLGMRMPMPQADNSGLVINALDSLSGSTDLIGVRSRGSFERPFHRMDALRQEAEKRFLEKEGQLEEELRATERRLTELQSQREGGSTLLLTPEQQQEIERFQERRVETRRELRATRHALAKDIESLEGWLKLVNILGVPVLLLGGAFVLRSLRSGP